MYTSQLLIIKVYNTSHLLFVTFELLQVFNNVKLNCDFKELQLRAELQLD